MSDRDDLIKEISTRIRIYKPKTENDFPVEVVFPIDFISKKTKEGKYFNKTETDLTLKMPDTKPIKAIYHEDHTVSNQYLELFNSTSDIYSKIIYINRALDYDFLSISKYQNVIQYYESLVNANSDTQKEEHIFYNTYKSSIDDQISWLKLLIDSIHDYNEKQCQVPILFDLDVKKRVESNNWALDNRRNFLDFITKTFNPLVTANLNSRGKTPK